MYLNFETGDSVVGFYFLISCCCGNFMVENLYFECVRIMFNLSSLSFWDLQ